MRVFAVLSTIAITASLAIVVPGSVAESTALASTTDTCVDMHGTAQPALDAGSYVIDSVEKLVYLSVNQNSTWLGRDFVQTTPIDLEGCLWTPIGTYDYNTDQELPFTGSFNGDGNPIRSLATSSGFYRGLFGFTDNANVSGVRLVNADVSAESFGGTLVGWARTTTISDSSATGVISGTGNVIGGLVGQATENTSISGAFSTVSVTGPSSGSAYGGLVGALADSIIQESFADGDVSAGNRTGGLAGDASSTSQVKESFSRGNVTGAESVGGLIGFLGSGTTLLVENSYATGTVIGDAKVGGLVGEINNGATIRRSFATGEVTGSPSGGLIGQILGSSPSVSGAFWDTVTTKQETSASNFGTGLTTEKMTTLATFTTATWKIVASWQTFDPDDGKVWGIRADLNGGYPYLLWEYETEPPNCGLLSDDGFHQVSTVDELRSVGLGGSNPHCGLGSKYRQMNNIDLAGTGPWTPIVGFDTESFELIFFTGHYDGGGHTISNMAILSEGAEVEVEENGEKFRDGMPTGFFVAISGAIVENLKFDNASIGVLPEDDPSLLERAAVPISGILAGLVAGSTIENVHVSNSNLTDLDLISGGLVGIVFGFVDGSLDYRQTTISGCSVEIAVASVNDAEIAFGGLVGVADEAELSVNDCEVTVEADISVAGSPQFDEFAGLQVEDLHSFVGGVVGAVGPDGEIRLEEVNLAPSSSITISQGAGSSVSDLPGVATGGLVGLSAGQLEITNSHVGTTSPMSSPSNLDMVHIAIESTQGFFAVGGVVGVSPQGSHDSVDTKISGSSATVHIYIDASASDVLVGALIGLARAVDLEDTAVHATIEIEADDNSYLEAGGVFGFATNVTVQDSTIHTDITIAGTTESLYVGGLAGFMDVADVTAVSVTATIVTEVTAVGDAYVGGLIGSAADISVDETTTDVDITIAGNTLDVYLGGLLGRGGDLVITSSTATVSTTITSEHDNVAAGGLLGYIEEEPATVVASSAMSEFTFDGMTRDFLDVGGLVGYGEETQIEESFAKTTMRISGDAGYVAAGGLFGYADESVISTSFADIDIDIDVTAGLVLAGGLVGESYAAIRYSSASGTLTLSQIGAEPEDNSAIIGGLVGQHPGNAPVADSWTSVGITIRKFDGDGELNVGGVFGEASGRNTQVVGSDVLTGAALTNVLSRGAITLDQSITARPESDDFAVFAGSFAGLLGDTEDDPPLVAGNVTRGIPGLNLVGKGPIEGIDAVSESQLITIEPFENASWDIVPASANNPPTGPDVEEIWGLDSSGVCAPLLWWQFANIADFCGTGITNPVTGITGGSGSGGGSGTGGAITPPLLPGQQNLLSPRPSQSGGPDDIDMDQAELPDGGNQPSTGDDSSSSTGTDAPDTTTETESATPPAGGLSTGALWAIGLGGVGAVALIAGGIAFARMRP